MTFFSVLLAVTVSFTPPAQSKTDLVFAAQAQPLSAPLVSLPPASGNVLDGDYVTTPDNCTYRRTKAPGYPEMWILVLNPHHIGRPNSPARCPGIM